MGHLSMTDGMRGKLGSIDSTNVKGYINMCHLSTTDGMRGKLGSIDSTNVKGYNNPYPANVENWVSS